MAVHKIKNWDNIPYFKVPQAIWNTELSNDAKLLYTYLTSRPEDWQVQRADISNKFGWGEHKVRRVLRELEENDCITNKTVRLPSGHYAPTVYHVYQDGITRTISDNGNTVTVLPLPYYRNRVVTNNKELRIKTKNKGLKEKEATASPPPQLDPAPDRTPVIAITRTPMEPVDRKAERKSVLQDKLSKLDLGDSVLYPQDKLGKSLLLLAGKKRFGTKDVADQWRFVVNTSDQSFEHVKEQYDYWRSKGKSEYVAVKCVVRQLFKIAEEDRVAGHGEELSEEDTRKMKIAAMYDRMGYIPPEEY